MITRRYDAAVFGAKRRALPDICADLVAAVGRRDGAAFDAAEAALPRAVRRADGAEMTRAVAVLRPAIEEFGVGSGGELARLAGGLLEVGADPGAVIGVLALHGAEALEAAVLLPPLWKGRGGVGRPDPQRLPEVLERCGPENRHVVEAWFAADEWVRALLVPLQRREVRAALPHRERLLAAAQAAAEVVEGASFLPGLLRVLDDETVVVLHRADGRAFEVTIGGIGDNFQLHTLLAHALIGGGLLPGTPPEPRWVAAATDGDPEPRGGIQGQFNLVDAFGEWIWNEGAPADIPLLGGRRVIVVDPPPYPRGWNAGRVYPLMAPLARVDRPLGAAEAAEWMGRIAPDAYAR
ncbi:hypothetical protein GCM10009735_65630 [Actinomadura chokoriensis]